MPIDESLVGRTGSPQRRSWDSRDTLLYAVGVGAGQLDPLDELQFTTENSAGIQQQVLPTFATVAVPAVDLDLLPGNADYGRMLHAEQAFTLTGALPAAGELESVSSVEGVYDKGSGALVVMESMARDSVGQVVATLRTSLFFRGYGGYGGDRGPAADWELPAGAPDHTVTYGTRRDQALLYRLTGDRNPLHSDPAFAARAGFERPILHGMCTYGFTGRALLHAVAGSDPKRFLGMSGRFTKPIYPGQAITVSIWVDGTQVRFRTTDEQGSTVIDQGTAKIR